MKPTIAYIEKKFDEFNRRMFAGRLPKLPVQLSDAGSFLGQCVYRQRIRPDGLKEYSDFSLRINTRFDLPGNVIEDTLIHEMIHYFILWNGLHDTSAHGNIFKAIMTGINTTHGRNITIRHKATEEEAEQAVSTRRTWHVIAAIYFKTGKTGVKVLPRTIPRILEYHKVVSAHPETQEIRLYLHDNPFFNRYPTSAAFRYHDIDRTLLETNLTKAHRLRIDGTRLIQS